MSSVCWSVNELGRLNKSGRKLYIDVGALLALLNNPETDFVRENVARRLLNAQEALTFHSWCEKISTTCSNTCLGNND